VNYQAIYDYACEHPSKTAIVYNGIDISYAAFAQAIGGTISYLDKQALPEGHTVVVRISILADCWVAVLALQALGLNTVCVKSVSGIESLSLRNIVGIVTTEIEAGIDPLEPDSRTGDRVISIPYPDYSSEGFPRASASIGMTRIGGHILYTSGTTGSYKKVFLDAELQQQRNAERIRAYKHNQEDTVYHCTDFGLWTSVGYKKPLYVWQMGGCIIFEQRPQWHQYFLQSAMTNTILIPDQVNGLLKFIEEHPLKRTVPDFYLLFGGGFISNTLVEKLRNRVSGYVENIYGSTEINVPTLQSTVENLDDLHWLLPSGYRVVEIVDEGGSVCPTDMEGELRVRLTALDCSSYLDDRQASEKVFRSGCFYPGDMAVRRADGRIRILGRSADVINIRGQKRSVAPFEHEIQQRLGVDAVCLFSGLSSEGEVELLIAIESEYSPEKSDLSNLLEEFAQFGQARFVRITKFPRTQTGTSKIDRIALRKLLFLVH
jgi:acyl-coenzyme A synthetase/AMP-(fatty) acid ligase